MVHLDSRHTAAAIVLAREANARNILVSLDVEKDRVFLSDLMPCCDIFFTNKEFPQKYFNIEEKDIDAFNIDLQPKDVEDEEEECEEDDDLAITLLSMTCLFSSGTRNDSENADNTSTVSRSRAELVVTTRGSKGSLLMRRKDTTDGVKAQIPFSRKGSFLIQGENPMEKTTRNQGQIPTRRSGSYMEMGENPMDKGTVVLDASHNRKGSFLMMGENPMDGISTLLEERSQGGKENHVPKRRGSYFEGENPMDTIRQMEKDLALPSHQKKSSFIVLGENPLSAQEMKEIHKKNIFLNENLLTIAPIKINHYVFSRQVTRDTVEEREDFEVIKYVLFFSYVFILSWYSDFFNIFFSSFFSIF